MKLEGGRNVAGEKIGGEHGKKSCCVETRKTTKKISKAGKKENVGSQKKKKQKIGMRGKKMGCRQGNLTRTYIAKGE